MANVPVVDLGVTVIPEDHKIWKVFPGEGYKFLNLMLESHLAFLDIRDLDKLGDDISEWDYDDLVETVSIDRWSRQVAATGNETDRRVSPTDKQNATMVDGLLSIAKMGDIVLIPHPGSDGNVTVGQLTAKPNKTSTIVAKDGRRNYTYVGRKFKTLEVIKKRKLPAELIELLQTPIAFFDTGNSARIQIYEKCYGSYIYDRINTATYRTSKDVYTSRDNRTVSTWMEFIDVISNRDSFTAARRDADSNSVVDLIDSANLDELDRSDLSININSPGEIIMKAVASSPLIGLALFPLAAENMPYAKAVEATVQLSAIGSASKQCEAEIGREVRSVLEALGARRWQKACEIAVRASTETTLSTESALKK